MPIRTLALVLSAGLLAGGAFGTGVALANHQFSDVSSVGAFHDDIDWATDQAIVGGFPDGTFRPKDPVNRQQATRWFRRFNERLTVVVESTNPIGASAFQLLAECPEGSRPLAGGARTSGATVFLVSSALDSVNNGWRAYWASPTGATVDPAELNVQVLCGPDL